MTITFADSPTLLLNQSVATSFVSNVVSLKNLNSASFQFKWSGTFTGSLSITAANVADITDPANPPASIFWDPIATLAITGGLNPQGGTSFIQEIETSLKYLRVEYTASSGTGTMNCGFYGKSQG